MTEQNLIKFFELERILQWVKLTCSKIIALQLPDRYLKYSFEISEYLKNHSESEYYVLADTSFRSCCLDIITAQHAKCDSICHFGESCFSNEVTGYNIINIFCHEPIDVSDFAVKLRSLVVEHLKEEVSGEIDLLFDSCFSHAQEIIREILDNTFKNQLKCFVNSICSESNTSKTLMGRRIRTQNRSSDNNCAEQNRTLIYIGSEESSLLSVWLLSFNKFSKVIEYYPNSKQINFFEPSSSKQLLKRLFLVEKLREADNVGLVIGSVTAKSYEKVLSRIKMLCQVAQKKYYMFYIGKINDAKLSNFSPDIDVFISLTCPFGIIMDTSNYHKPIVSIFEAEIALNRNKANFFDFQWTSEYWNFIDDEISTDADMNTTVDSSLLSGRIRETAYYNKIEDCQGLIEYSLGSNFENRSWKGLTDCQCKHDLTSNKIEKGLEGIATRYDSEQH